MLKYQNWRRAGWMLAIATVLLLSLACQQTQPDPGPAVVAPDTIPDSIEPSSPDSGTAVTVTSAGQLTGLEAFISIGGIAGYGHATVQAALVNGYQRAGYRVHYVAAAMSFAPFATAMRNVADEYVASGRSLRYVIFHHTGHGWDDHISYQAIAPDGSLASGSTTHLEVAQTIRAKFPKTTNNFRNTGFGLIYDACGQGTATSFNLAGRPGFVATSTPDAAPPQLCMINNCPYTCEACLNQTVSAYVYSTEYGQVLAPSPADNLIPDFHLVAHNFGMQALVQASSPSGCTGKFKRN